MEDWSFVESRFDDLAADLEDAKKHPFKVKLDFDHRFRVWQSIIHRNRRLHISALVPEEQEAMVKRYVSLDLYDLARLLRRAKKEFLWLADDSHIAKLTLILFQNLYSNRVRELGNEIKYQFSQYELITGVDIVTEFSNGWTQIGGV